MKLAPAVFAAVAFITPIAGAADRAASGASLVVPAAHADLGVVYHVQPGKDAQVTFTSDAPLEHIKGVSNQLVGYAVAGPADRPAALQAGVFLLPVASMDTGIPLRNEHMQGERWLDAGSHPDIVFSITATKDDTLVKSGDGFTTYTVTLVGDMTIKGMTMEMAIPARLTFMAESDRTKARANGDLLALRCEYTIELAEFDVNGGGAGKVADVIELDQALFFSTIRAEDQRR